MKLTAQQRDAREAIWYSLEITRGRMDAFNSLQLSLFILMWAKFIPQSKENVIGYFDVLEGIDRYRIELIQNELGILTGINTSELIFRDELTRDLETLRVTLLPVAKLIAKGDIEDIDNIVRSFKSFTSTLLGKKGNNEINEGILKFSKIIFDDIKGNNKEMNCLYPRDICCI